MSKVIVDKDLCIGCGMCVSIAPSCFAFDDDGKAIAVCEGEVPAEAEDSAANCPAQAIVIE